MNKTTKTVLILLVVTVALIGTLSYMNTEGFQSKREKRNPPPPPPRREAKAPIPSSRRETKAKK